MSHRSLRTLRHLVLVLGDQLDDDAVAFDGFDPAQDAVWMAEVAEESTHIPSSQMRTAFFLSAMRHFAADLRTRRRPLHYRTLDDPANRGTLAAELRAALAALATPPAMPAELTPQSVQERFTGTGVGHKTVTQMCAETATDESVALRRLREAGMEAVGSDTLKAVGERHDLQPIRALQAMLIGPQALPKPGGSRMLRQRPGSTTSSR
jgi:hypothetical protein